LIKIIILEENFKWHLEAFASELFIYRSFLKTTSVVVSLIQSFLYNIYDKQLYKSKNFYRILYRSIIKGCYCENMSVDQVDPVWLE